VTDENVYRPDQLLKDAAKHGELVVFVGAGASMLCGSPDWRGFANHVVGALERTRGLSFLEAEQLRGLGDPRRTLSIAMALAKEQNVILDFDDILHPSKPAPAGAELYELLSSLRPVFVTTNYDRWLDEEGPEVAAEAPTGEESKPARGPTRRPKYYLKEHLTSDRLAERGAVIHLHGSCAEPSSMVVSLKDYIEHYADARVQNFLSEMFRSHTVLFVGYGLAEMEVLDYIVRSNKSISAGSAEPRHFILYAHRSSESVQTKFIERFFRDQCGVQVVPYCIDTKGYGELVEVFKSWEPQLDVRDPTLLDLQAHLDRCAATAEPSQRESAVRLVLKHPELTAYFLNSLKDPVWFDDLEGAGFFRVENSPGVKEVQGEKGVMYQADGWPALRYLEQVSPLVSTARAKRVAEIVRAVTADSRQRKLDNWRTWWSLATIMSQLPLAVIDESDIDLARSWLMGRFEANMVGHELGGRLLPRLLDSADPVDWKKAMTLVDALATLRKAEHA
jgi:NAD-dependent SIR2 family protein deacetylase